MTLLRVFELVALAAGCYVLGLFIGRSLWVAMLDKTQRRAALLASGVLLCAAAVGYGFGWLVWGAL